MSSALRWSPTRRKKLLSSQPPALYGFIPRTYCGEKVGALTPDGAGLYFVSDRNVSREIFVQQPMQGFIMLINVSFQSLHVHIVHKIRIRTSTY